MRAAANTMPKNPWWTSIESSRQVIDWPCARPRSVPVWSWGSSSSSTSTSSTTTTTTLKFCDTRSLPELRVHVHLAGAAHCCALRVVWGRLLKMIQRLHTLELRRYLAWCSALYWKFLQFCRHGQCQNLMRERCPMKFTTGIRNNISNAVSNVISVCM